MVVLLACLFLSVLAGGVTGVVVNRIDSAGYFVSWQRLPDPPAAATSLALGVTGRDEFNQMFTLYARLASGDSVALPLREAVWQPVASPPDNAATLCSPSLPALARTANPPAGLTGCIYHFERWYDCHSQRAFALDSDGRVWQWINTRCALGMLGVVLIAFVVSGLIYLLLSSLLAMVWLRRRERAGR